MFYLYILESEFDQSFYIGSTENLENRVNEHNFGNTRFTKRKRPWKVIYFEEYKTRGEAIKRERYLKRLKSRKYINYLIVRARSSTVEQ